MVYRFVKINNFEWTEDIIRIAYTHYLTNILNLAKIANIEDITLYNKDIIDEACLYEDKNNPYLKTKKEILSLGNSIIKNGTYWIFLTKDNKLAEGMHRYWSLRKYVENNNNTNITFPAINLKDIDYTGYEIIYFKAKNIKHFKDIGCEFKTRQCKYEKDWFFRFMNIPLILRYVFYEWEKKYEFYPTSPLCNDILKLKEAIKIVSM